MEEREAEAVTKEQVYRDQMKALGIYQEILEPEIKTLAKIERQITRAEKAWSDTAPPDGKPSFLDPHFAIIQKLRDEAAKHREILGITAKALAKITGASSTAPDQGDLITQKLDAIAERVAGYDDTNEAFDRYIRVNGGDPNKLQLSGIPAADEVQAAQDMYETLPDAQAAARISDIMDEELRRAVHEDMG